MELLVFTGGSCADYIDRFFSGGLLNIFHEHA
jgi:hypothetical protein